MSRNLARRGASVLVAGALLGGGLALGGGTASAVELQNGSLDLSSLGTGSAEDVPLLRDVSTASAEATGSVLINAGVLMDAWIDNGLIDTGSQKFSCTANTYDCPI